MKPFRVAVPAALAIAWSAAACSLLDLEELSGGRSSSPGSLDAAGSAGEQGSGATGSSEGGAGAVGVQTGAAAVDGGAGGASSSSTVTVVASSGTGCMPICTPNETTYVDCGPCLKRPDTCSSDGCSISQGACTAFQCQADQICGQNGQCCFGDTHYCNSPGECCGGVCVSSTCYSCKPYGESCSNDAECCPGAPFCDFGKCMGN